VESDLTLARAYLARVAARLRDAGLRTHILTVQGDSPAKTIAEVATQERIDLIALATHGYGGLKRTLVGSVADHLLHTTNLPMLVMRPPATA
jgi:nucleotide-binding universal stress UspA family protein